jgi:hypothetical protein
MIDIRRTSKLRHRPTRITTKVARLYRARRNLTTRADMAKVLVERPRRGGQYHRQGRPLAVELLPTKEGMRRRWTDRKELNEHLAPLRRFLGSRVGRRWDSVYAELSAQLTPRNAVQQHVRSHLTDFVALHLVVAPDGTLVDPGWRFIGW